jgi:4-hydroxy-tetrahydrodipicolinate synthase
MKRGSTVALVTPFHPDTGKIDYPTLEKLLQHHVQEGTDNLCILGTTGEASVMSMEERERVLKIAVEQAKGKMPILAGTGTIDPMKVKAMTQQAIDMGCDASLMVTPYYVKPPQRGLIKHFTTMADIGLPVILYNVPGRTASNLLDSSIATLAQHENIIGVKDATGDLGRLDSLKKELSAQGYQGDFLCYSGDDSSTTEFVLKGGDGCISVTANCAPKIMHEMVAAALKGDEKEAYRLNDLVMPLHKGLFCEASPMPAKWAVSRLGLIGSSYCRPPLDILDPALEETVETALKAAGLI